MIGELCGYLRNYFCKKKYFGGFTISNGTIQHDGGDMTLLPGQYIRIVGSVLNDGVYEYSESMGLVDETFTGAVWAMAVPADLIALAAEIEQWKQKNQKAIDSPYTSESYGGYSYTKATGADGAAYDWKTHFASRLNRWRKIRV